MNAKVRIYELAKELEVPNKDLVNYLKNMLKLSVKSHSSSISDYAAAQAKHHYGKGPAPKPPKVEKPKEPEPTPEPVIEKPKPEEKEVALKPAVTSPPEKTLEDYIVKRAADVVPPVAKIPARQPRRVTSASDAPPHARTNTIEDKSKAKDSAFPMKKTAPKATVSSFMPKSQPSQAPRGGRNQPGTGGKGKGKKGKGRNQSAPEPIMEAPVMNVVAEDLPRKQITFDHNVTVRELAVLLDKRDTEVIKYLFMKGIMVTLNHTLDFDAMLDTADHFEIDADVAKVKDMSNVEVVNVLDRKAQVGDHLTSRAPVISIMGHVDHGKTSLLDAIREKRNNIVDSEAGGITQSIGAYTVNRDGQKAVFLDTPGHEAFTAMRMRGAQSTDIAILVVAADDGVMPQTIEAINHAKAAGIPIIVAVNKVDKVGADPDRVMTALMNHGVISEKFGGDAVTVEVSALKRTGIDDLLENILLLAELLELKADSTVAAEGVIIEAKLDKGKGPVASVLIQKGILNVGDNILMGSVGGRVRALIDDSGQRIQSAGPSTPVEILGLTEVPASGALMQVVQNNQEFKKRLGIAQTAERDRRLSERTRNAGGLTTSLDDENKKELRIVLKADTHGSLEAAASSLNKLGTSEVQVNIIHTGTGDLTEADVMLATASRAVILAFNSREDGNAGRLAEQERVIIHRFDVIYHMVERVEKLMLGELDADIIEVESGKAEIRQHFNVGKIVVVAGCMVTEGKIVRSGRIEVQRKGKVIFEGFLDALKRFKEEAKEVAQGFECGITVAKYNDHEIGDIIVCYTQEERKRTSL